MKPFNDITQYLRSQAGRLQIDLDRIGARLAGRGALLGAAILFAAVAGALLPVRAGMLLAALAGLAIWAALAQVPERVVAMPADGASDAAGGPNVRTVAGSIVNALSDPALVVDGRLTVVAANAAADDIFGGVRVGTHISTTSRSPALSMALAETLKTQQRATFALDMRTPLERHLEGIVAPMQGFSDAADATYMLIHVRDLTEQDRLSAMRADFVANASHELRTPLASLKGFIETLKGPARDDAAARERFLDIMGQQAERMTRLIDDLLSLSRIEMRAHIAPSERVDLNDIVRSVVAALEPQAALAGAVVSIRAAERAVVVRGDHDELMQAVQNLVQNAIKYGKRDGHIDVEIADAGNGRATVGVTDDGPGIAPEHLPRLTERFYRVNVASSRDRGGTGLGLAIVKHIVTRHRGSLGITSAPGKGSTFTLTLPLAK